MEETLFLQKLRSCSGVKVPYRPFRRFLAEPLKISIRSWVENCIGTILQCYQGSQGRRFYEGHPVYWGFVGRRTGGANELSHPREQPTRHNPYPAVTDADCQNSSSRIPESREQAEYARCSFYFLLSHSFACPFSSYSRIFLFLSQRPFPALHFFKFCSFLNIFLALNNFIRTLSLTSLIFIFSKLRDAKFCRFCLSIFFHTCIGNIVGL